MKGIFLGLAALTLSLGAHAEGEALPLQFKLQPDNMAAAQRGARDFMAYCSGCHSMRNLRYSRLGRDLGIPDDKLKANLMFTSDKPGDQIKSAMPADDAKKWFGQTPPDLTVEARMRGPEWLYNYLMTFYVDPTRPTGMNNLVLPNASMPHVLWELQGLQAKKAEPRLGEGNAEAAAEHEGGTGLELVQPGSQTPEQYEKTVADIVTFMAYAAEPGRAQRIATGAWVMAYLIFLLLPLTYFLKKEYWKDVH
ncbi:MAG TPA: cytochrome c1 [Nevskiaceae bacterium]|nr:cytochrome c1 [Nevskiaceae bacterium]